MWEKTGAVEKRLTRAADDLPGEARPEKGPPTILLLRWVLIIATAYLLLFYRPLSATPPIIGIFIAFYMASNLAVGYLLPRVRSQRIIISATVLFDTLAVSLALLLSQSFESDFFLLYFVVLLVGTFTESLLSVVGTALLISLVHFFTVARFVGIAELMHGGHFLRVPFLFVVGLVFGHLIQRARGAEREATVARQQERLQADLMATATHDLKNPLAAMQGLMDLLVDGEFGPLNPEQLDVARGIQSGVHRVITLALNVLDATRIETGRLSLDRAPGRVEPVVEETVSLLHKVCDNRKISLKLSFGRDQLPSVDIDVVQLGRAVWNLVDNAIKYTPRGGSIAVSVAEQAGQVRVSVHNSGPGIPAEQMTTLFDRYHNTGAGNPLGTGLGLYIVKAITEAHGGTVGVESDSSEGTTFTIRLPIYRAETATAQAP